MTRLMIVVGSVRPGRVGLPVARWVASVAQADARFEIDFADLLEIGLPLMDEPNHPRLRQYTKHHTLEWSARVDAADAFIFVTPEYNYSYAPALKNAIDYLHTEWTRKPLGVVSYGGISGGTRGVVALRVPTGAVGLISTLVNVEISWVSRQIDDEGEFGPNEVQSRAILTMLDDLAALDVALRPVRPVRPA